MRWSTVVLGSRSRALVAAVLAGLLVVLLVTVAVLRGGGESTSGAGPGARAAASVVRVSGARPRPYPPDLADRRACRRGLIALTFDDGPSTSVTPGLVRELRRLEVPATFFMVGERVAWSPTTARLVARAGFLIGNHTYLHQDMATQSAAEVRRTLVRTDHELRRVGVHPTHLVRPPYGAVDPTALRTIHSLGDTSVLWTIDSRDWTGLPTGAIAAGVLDHLQPHGVNIVLQHDGVANSPATARAVPIEVRQARRRGYCFAPLNGHGLPGMPVPAAHVAAPASVPEGRRLVVRVELDQPTMRPVSVLMRIARGATATVEHWMTVPAGAVTARYAVPVPRLAGVQPPRRYSISLLHPQGVRFAGSTRTFTVTDAGAAPPAPARSESAGPPAPPALPVLTGVDRHLLAPTSGRRKWEVVLSLSRPATRSASVRVTAVGGTARAGRDFVPLRRVVRVAAGRRSVQVPVELLARPRGAVGPRSFRLRLSDAHGVRLGRAATVTVAAA